MSRIASLFESLKLEGRTALIPFITAGYPNPEVSVPLMHALVEGGANIIELGVSFSDPMADGPVIQQASEQALRHGMNLSRVINMVENFRKDDRVTPVVLMGYLNPIEVMGYDVFTNKAAAAGVDGCLVVDLPPEEADELTDRLNKRELDQVFLISSTTTDTRLDMIRQRASGFLYYVSLRGVTGSSGQLNMDEIQNKLQQIRTYTSLPLGVGFGIKDAETAAKVARVSDAVVIGSSLVYHLSTVGEETGKITAAAGEFINHIRSVIDVV